MLVGFGEWLTFLSCSLAVSVAHRVGAVRALQPPAALRDPCRRGHRPRLGLWARTGRPHAYFAWKETQRWGLDPSPLMECLKPLLEAQNVLERQLG